MSGVAFRHESISVEGMHINHVSNIRLLHSDEATANSTLDNIISHFKTENPVIYQQALPIQQMPNSPEKFRALRTLIQTSSPWILVVDDVIGMSGITGEAK